MTEVTSVNFKVEVSKKKVDKIPVPVLFGLNNKIDKPYIAFSSDDGFKNNLFAAEILNNYGASACFFINPGLVEECDFQKIKNHCRNKLHLPPIEFLNWASSINNSVKSSFYFEI